MSIFAVVANDTETWYIPTCKFVNGILHLSCLILTSNRMYWLGWWCKHELWMALDSSYWQCPYWSVVILMQLYWLHFARHIGTKNWTVVAALYGMTNWHELCHKVILSTTNTQPAKTTRTNCIEWIACKGHLNQNVGLVQSGKSSVDEDKKELHMSKYYISADRGKACFWYILQYSACIVYIYKADYLI